MKNIYVKIANVMKGIRTVKKNGWNEYNKYDYTTEKDLLDEVKPLLLKNGLIIVPSVVDQKRTGDIATVKVEFTLVDIDSGEELKTVFYGEGQDKGDKATYKAYTGAVKYYLMKTFMIPTGDDPEADEAPKVKTVTRTPKKDEIIKKDKIIEIKRKWNIFKSIDEFKTHFGKNVEELTETEAETLTLKLDEKLEETNITTSQRKAIFGLGRKRGLSGDQTKQVCYDYTGVGSLKEMSALQAYRAYSHIETMKEDMLKKYIGTEATMTKSEIFKDIVNSVTQLKAMGVRG